MSVLPDTQIYSLRHPELFHGQTAFLAAAARPFDIRFVVHLGDVVHNNSDREWQHAAAALARLDGVISMAIVPGNHDSGPGGLAATRETQFARWLSHDRKRGQPEFAATFEPGKLENIAQHVSLAGHDFLVIALEWAPRDEVLAWASALMARHPDHLGILVTHAYLDEDGQRQNHRESARNQIHNPHRYPTPGSVNDGEEIWQKLVRHHRFALVLSGHVLGDGEGYLLSVTDRGTRCHQLLANYQMRARGGGGLLRLLEFMPAGGEVRVHTYNPLEDVFLYESGHNFSIRLRDEGVPLATREPR